MIKKYILLRLLHHSLLIESVRCLRIHFLLFLSFTLCENVPKSLVFWKFLICLWNWLWISILPEFKSSSKWDIFPPLCTFYYVNFFRGEKSVRTGPFGQTLGSATTYYSLNATVRPCAEKLREIFTCCQL